MYRAVEMSDYRGVGLWRCLIIEVFGCGDV